MATTNIRWRGPKELVQQKLRWSFTAEGDELIVPFEGPLSVALAKKPKPGQTLRGFTDGGLKVVRVEIEEGDGGSAKMTVHLGAPKAPDDEVTFEPLGEPVFELVWTRETRPIEAHPRCGILKADRGNHPTLGKPVTWDDWQSIRTEDYDSTGSAPGGGVKWGLATYKRLKERGIDDYFFCAPEVKRTVYYLRDPGGIGVGLCTVMDPPVGAPLVVGGNTLEYLFIEDTFRKEGRLRVRESTWQGHNSISDDVYP